ncbi:transmembrane protein 186 [Glossina fuscipes fuscipes]
MFSLLCKRCFRNCSGNKVIIGAKFLNIPQGNFYFSSKVGNQPVTVDENQWETIYHLPLIRLASAYNRVKKPYGLFTALAIPAAYGLEHASQLPPSAGMLVAIVGVTSCLTLALSSLAFENLVGFIYVNESNDKVKLAFINYWGERDDRIINMNDLILSWEQKKPIKLGFYQLILLHSDPKVKYKLLHRHGAIENSQAFAALFGE